MDREPTNKGPTSGSTRHGQAAGFRPAVSVPKMNVFGCSRRLPVRVNLVVGLHNHGILPPVIRNRVAASLPSKISQWTRYHAT